MDFQEFIKPELLILVPVLYLIGMGLKKLEAFNDKYIPIILGILGVIMSCLWVFTTADWLGGNVATIVFTAITQGVLVAGASVYVNQIYKQASNE